MNATTEKNMIL